MSVDTAAGDYHIDLRPFHLATGRLGDVTVHTTSTTEFEIDGTAYTGTAGITALAALPAGSPTAAFGTLNVDQRRFTAARVHAGTSVASAQFDVVEGNVIARSVTSSPCAVPHSFAAAASWSSCASDTTLVVGADTKVTKDGDARRNSLTSGALSVGQRIHAFGAATEASNGDVTLDATAGRVRMHLTRLLGTVKSTLPGSVTLDLATIDRHRAAAFDFAGTGVSPAQDAEASSYDVDTGNLNLSSLDVGKAARVFGFVTPFGTAPPDFEGRTLVDFRDVPAVLSIGWGFAGTSAPFLVGGCERHRHRQPEREHRCAALHRDRAAAHRREDTGERAAPRHGCDEARHVRNRRAAPRGGVHHVRGLHSEAHGETRGGREGDRSHRHRKLRRGQQRAAALSACWSR